MILASFSSSTWICGHISVVLAADDLVAVEIAASLSAPVMDDNVAYLEEVQVIFLIQMKFTYQSEEIKCSRIFFIMSLLMFANISYCRCHIS